MQRYEVHNPTALNRHVVVGGQSVPSGETAGPFTLTAAMREALEAVGLVLNLYTYPNTPGTEAPTDVLAAGNYGYTQISGAPGTAQDIEPDTRTQLIFTVDPARTMAHLLPPFAAHTFWSGNRVRARALDDVVLLRLNLRIDAQVADGRLSLDVDIGGSSSIILQRLNTLLLGSAGVAEEVSGLFNLYMRQSFLTNGAALYLRSTVPLTVLDPTLFFTPLTAATP